MSARDPQLHDQQRELEALKARLGRQEKTTGIAVIVAMVLATLTIALFIDGFLDGEWPLGHLPSFIP
jgi:hypothetical protein